MIPFQLHRRIPLIRRPFFQRDRALSERDEAKMRWSRAEAERDEARSALLDLKKGAGNQGVPFWDLGEHRGIVRANNGNLICIDTRDEPVCGTIRRSGCWETHLESVYRRLLKPNSVVVEVGSNVGYHTAAFARIARSVIAVEANPFTAAILRSTLALNHFRNVSVNECAIMDRPQMVELFTAETNLGAGSIGRPGWHDDPALADWRRYPVSAVTLDSITSDLPAVDLIHLDIEGCELPALMGAASLLSRSPDATIIMEWGAYWAPDYGDLAVGLDYLESLGFGYFWRIDPSDATLTSKNKQQMLEREFCDVLITRSPSSPA
jgi:FkbM family methyltransferase